jgi:hypothetical protein
MEMIRTLSLWELSFSALIFFLEPFKRKRKVLQQAIDSINRLSKGTLQPYFIKLGHLPTVIVNTDIIISNILTCYGITSVSVTT